MTVTPEPMYVAEAPEPVELDVFAPERQRRWTVLLRLLLVIPQLVAVWVLQIVGTVVVIVGWFAALVLGRLPEWCGELLRSIVAYEGRVAGYVLLLVDRYPPFTFEVAPVGYPVRVWFPAPTRLNRLAVLFRLVLAFPMLVVSNLLYVGWSSVAVIVWLVTLILGRQPRALFEASAAGLRIHVRTMSYVSLLTPAYPWGIFGDDAAAAGRPPASPTRPLLVSTAGKVLLVVFLILGVLAEAVSGSVSSTEDDDSTEVTTLG
ncbi:DUF4389 domain-containing protein [Nocardia sp. CDC159]|uniref:DUF4389 domain-containing protein n=1 Tax=Nocardia pulmonis TaxID=2951408 RepID=A0A9X2EDV5_9NOCA|nr:MULTISPECIES: DUF4389 domain-containing protein [Nocardia]MCM6777660.1 DUF4389 domain-containing protein [Nocardia pulmonis]MCM6790536.1 DUF4389 domain-containing protein [Nocardia sp. CDC159]